MKKIIMTAVLLASTLSFAKETTTTTAFIRGNTMAEVKMKVDQFLVDIKTDKNVNLLIPRECNPSSNRRVERKAYSIDFFQGNDSYTVTGNGEWVSKRPHAQVKVLCTSYKNN